MTRYIALTVAGALVALLCPSCVPNLHRAEMAAREASAVAAIRTIHTAEVQYSSEYGHFAASLADLASLIDAELASGQKNGYKFSLSASGTGYQITAVPLTFNVTGARTFFSDETLTIRQNHGAEPATASSPDMQAQ